MIRNTKFRAYNDFHPNNKIYSVDTVVLDEGKTVEPVKYLPGNYSDICLKTLPRWDVVIDKALNELGFSQPKYSIGFVLDKNVVFESFSDPYPIFCVNPNNDFLYSGRNKAKYYAFSLAAFECVADFMRRVGKEVILMKPLAAYFDRNDEVWFDLINGGSESFGWVHKISKDIERSPLRDCT